MPSKFIYKDYSLGLATDLYQITMAYGYFKNNMADRWANFNLYFRNIPFNGQFAVASGLYSVVKYLQSLSEFWFSNSDLDYLHRLTGNDGNKLFDKDFLDFLQAIELKVSIQAIPEGTPVFGHEPLLTVSGPLAQCQLLETALLNQINFNTLIATKAYRVCQAAGKDPVFDFGFRRGQGFDGALSASRACYVGGCAGTSNVLASKMYGIPVKGTMAHSWIMSFESEYQAMKTYVEAMPNNSVLLVDTYDTLTGVQHAIEAGRILKQMGHDLSGIRLDSGDLSALSKKARAMLDEAGFAKTIIIASNDLDEKEIIRLKDSGARIDAWGVGTKLITAYDQPALGGVYKLSAIQRANGKTEDVIKTSVKNPEKASLPGIQQVRRFTNVSNNTYSNDVIYDSRTEDPTSAPFYKHEDLLQDVYENGQLVAELPGIEEIRKRLADSVCHFDWNNSPVYPVVLSQGISSSREKLTTYVRQ